MNNPIGYYKVRPPISGHKEPAKALGIEQVEDKAVKSSSSRVFKIIHKEVRKLNKPDTPLVSEEKLNYLAVALVDIKNGYETWLTEGSWAKRKLKAWFCSGKLTAMKADLQDIMAYSVDKQIPVDIKNSKGKSDFKFQLDHELAELTTDSEKINHLFKYANNNDKAYPICEEYLLALLNKDTFEEIYEACQHDPSKMQKLGAAMYTHFMLTGAEDKAHKTFWGQFLVYYCLNEVCDFDPETLEGIIRGWAPLDKDDIHIPCIWLPGVRSYSIWRWAECVRCINAIAKGQTNHSDDIKEKAKKIIEEGANLQIPEGTDFSETFIVKQKLPNWEFHTPTD